MKAMERFLHLKKDTISLLLLLVFVLTIPLKNNLNSISIILLGVYSLIVFLQTKQFKKSLFIKLLPLILFFILSLLSIFYSEDKGYAIDLVVRLLPFLIFPFVFSILSVSKKQLVVVLKSFILWMTLVCLYSHSMVLYKLFENNDILFNLFNNHYSYMSLANDTIGLHTTYYAYYVLIAIVFLVYFLFQEKRTLYRSLYFLLLLYLSFFIFHLSTRTPIAVLFLFFNFSILYYFFKQKKTGKGIALLLLLYIVTSITVYNVRTTRYRFQQLFGFTYYNGLHQDDGENKLIQWEAAIHANKNIVFGNGIGDADASIFKSYIDFSKKTFAEREYNAHNQFIQTYVSLGLVGVVLLLLIFLFYCRAFYKQSFFIGYTIMVLTFFLFQTESYLVRHNGIVMFVFLICIFINYSSLNNKELNT
tara:strand:- start:58082 stop:59335 length:1254 start_codon:yes stop_codon:yes gene_type:complete